MANASNDVLCWRQSLKSAAEVLPRRPLGRNRVSTIIMRSDCGNGSARSNTASITLKMAVFAPIPSARTTTTIAVVTGSFRSERKAGFSDIETSCRRRVRAALLKSDDELKLTSSGRVNLFVADSGSRLLVYKISQNNQAEDQYC